MAGFEVVEGTAPNVEQFPKQKPVSDLSINALKIALGALSQRTLVALSNLFCLLTVGSVFWLFMSIHEPNVFQIVYCTLYASFILAINWVARKT